MCQNEQDFEENADSTDEKNSQQEMSKGQIGVEPSPVGLSRWNWSLFVRDFMNKEPTWKKRIMGVI